MVLALNFYSKLVFIRYKVIQFLFKDKMIYNLCIYVFNRNLTYALIINETSVNNT